LAHLDAQTTIDRKMNYLKNLIKKRNEPIKSYGEFWIWFQKNEKNFYNVVKEQGDIEKDFFDKLSPKLKELKDGFFYLTGMFDDNTVELVLTADGAIKNIGFVEELVNTAPKIDGWLFTALKPALNIKDVNIEMAGYKFNDKNISFYANDDSNFPDEINVTIVHNDLNKSNKSNKSTVTNGTYIFLDNLLGELNFAITIDELDVIGKGEAAKELVPIEKLKDFLIWRQKEFIEKYEGIKYNTENDNYSMLKAELESGNTLFAVINTDLLQWDSKASHPWVLSIEIKYDGDGNNGMPDNDTFKLLDKIEDEISEELKDFDGYLNIGRQTTNNVREIYFACKDFRKPSKVLYNKIQKYSTEIDLDYSIYKDKYWQSFNRFINN
jgi:Family of unknown function (DUF695)